MNIQEIINRYQGKTLCYPAGAYCGECLSSVKIYIKDYFGINPPSSGVNAAYGYWTNFPSPLGTKFNKVANTPTGVPKPGDIIIWNSRVGAGFVHIAIVIDANVNAFRSLDQNWGTKYGKIITHNYTNIYGWLTPKETNMYEPLTPEQVDQVYLIYRGQLPSASERVGRTTSIYKDFGAEVKASREALIKQINAVVVDKDKLTTQVAEQKVAIDNLNIIVKDLQKQVGDIKPEKDVVEGWLVKLWNRLFK